MTRREALLVLLAAFALIAAGLTWLTGGWGLLISGVLLAIGVTTGINIAPEPEERRGEAVERPAPRNWRDLTL